VKRKQLNQYLAGNPELLDRCLLLCEPPSTQVVRTARDADKVLRPLLAGRTTEAFAAAALNQRNQVLAAKILTTGSDQHTIVDAHLLFRWALLQGRSGARAVVIAHNHPSNNTSASLEDITATRRLSAAGKIVGIQLFDHLVITDHGFLSLRESGNFLEE
jgi:DNA repair protein RadC